MTDPVSMAGTAMVERLSGLLDRRFVVGALLPAILFAAANLALAHAAGRLDLALLWRDLEGASTIAGTVAVLCALGGVWMLAISLVALNTCLVRRLEGYVPGRRWRAVLWLERRKLGWLDEQIAAGEASGGEASDDATLRLRVLRATWFSPREEELLPTAFGNAVRAFEAYPGELYGFEATRGWARLLTVMPAEYRDVVADAKSQVDLLVNLWFLSWVFAAEALVVRWVDGSPPGAWVPAAGLAGAVFAARRARHAAVRWGEVVKSAFDVYLPELRRRLDLPRPSTRDEEWRMWSAVSRAFLTREPDGLPELSGRPVPRPPADRGEGGEDRGTERHLRPV